MFSLAVYLRIIGPLYQGEHPLPRATPANVVVLTVSLGLTIFLGAGAQVLLTHVP